MADRFPSIEEFDNDPTVVPVVPSFENSDPDDFLSREKALLGEDASQFMTSSDGMAFLSKEDDNLLQGDTTSIEIVEGVSILESNFPALETHIENETITENITTYKPLHESLPLVEEPEVIKNWRECRDLSLSERAARSEALKQETIKNAQKNIDEFYENYNAKKEKIIAQSRQEAEEFLASRQDTSAGGTSWERISKLVDLSGKGVKGGACGTDKAKFRDLLISLKKDQNAPGASGY